MLTQDEINTMRRNGLTDIEIGVINENIRQRPQTIDLDNEAWQSYFRDRMDYIRGERHRGKSMKAIHDKIISFIRRQQGTPWDFLRDAYPVKGHKRSDFNNRIKAHAKIKGHFGRAY